MSVDILIFIDVWNTSAISWNEGCDVPLFLFIFFLQLPLESTESQGRQSGHIPTAVYLPRQDVVVMQRYYDSSTREEPDRQVVLYIC